MNCFKTKRGFTLIELLVVIAIIGILGALLLPCLAKAKIKARMVEEMSAGKQLMLASQLYSEDFKGAVFPGYVTDPNAVDDTGKKLFLPENTRYPWRIIPYLSGSMKLIYSGENRAKLAEFLARGNHDSYVYTASLYPSLGINSYFIGGHQDFFPADTVNSQYGSGTVLTKVNGAKKPSDLMMFLSARYASTGDGTGGSFHVTPPYLKSRAWSAVYSATEQPSQWGYVAPRLNNHSVAALVDGHVESFNLQQMQDMRHWCNVADRADWTLPAARP